MRVKVELTHILRGVRSDLLRCPLALAVQEASGAPVATVGLNMVGIYHEASGGWRYAYLPNEAACFRASFDRGLEIEPFEFDLPDLARWAS